MAQILLSMRRDSELTNVTVRQSVSYSSYSGVELLSELLSDLFPCFRKHEIGAHLVRHACVHLSGRLYIVGIGPSEEFCHYAHPSYGANSLEHEEGLGMNKCDGQTAPTAELSSCPNSCLIRFRVSESM